MRAVLELAREERSADEQPDERRQHDEVARDADAARRTRSGSGAR